MIPASFGGWSPKLMSYKCYTHIILKRIWLWILSTYLFHPFIMEIPHSDSARTDKICFFKTPQSWSKVGILWGTFDIPVGKFYESENFCQVYPVGAESATALQKTPLVNSHWVPLNLLWSLSVLFNSPLVPTVDKFYIILKSKQYYHISSIIQVEYLITFLFKDAFVCLCFEIFTRPYGNKTPLQIWTRWEIHA